MSVDANATPNSKSGESFFQKVEAFVTETAEGIPGKFEYQLPSIKETQTVDVFGRQITFTEELQGEKLVVTSTPA